MTPDEEQRLSIAICRALAVTPPDQPIDRRSLMKDLGPMFEGVSLEELSDAITRHCEALGRELSNQRDPSATFKSAVRILKPYTRRKRI
jgi:hypothetical protein